MPGKRPESVDAAVGDTAVFYCEAAGVPSVEYYWFLNGVRIESKSHDVLRDVMLFVNISS